MSFHPDKNMPGCMLPDGGNACLGYATLRDEWNRQRWRIEALEAALKSLLDDPPPTLDEPDEDYVVIVKMRDIARAALAELPKTILDEPTSPPEQE